jgi:hypothetical protein
LRFSRRGELVGLVELGVVEQRYQAVREVLDGYELQIGVRAGRWAGRVVE